MTKYRGLRSGSDTRRIDRMHDEPAVLNSLMFYPSPSFFKKIY